MKKAKNNDDFRAIITSIMVSEQDKYAQACTGISEYSSTSDGKRFIEIMTLVHTEKIKLLERILREV